jgi:hypothetical protein
MIIKKQMNELEMRKERSVKTQADREREKKGLERSVKKTS